MIDKRVVWPIRRWQNYSLLVRKLLFFEKYPASTNYYTRQREPDLLSNTG
ncbi:hypothetical protein [Spirosoma gilvum]